MKKDHFEVFHKPSLGVRVGGGGLENFAFSDIFEPCARGWGEIYEGYYCMIMNEVKINKTNMLYGIR